MYMNYYLFMFMLLMNLFMMSYFYEHLMLILMSLEFLMMSMLIYMINIFYNLNFGEFILFYLIFVVCESVLGLTLLILVIRSNGNDKMNFINLLLW